MTKLELLKNAAKRERKYIALLSGDVKRAVKRGLADTARQDTIYLVRHTRALQDAQSAIDTARQDARIARQYARQRAADKRDRRTYAQQLQAFSANVRAKQSATRQALTLDCRAAK